MYINNHFLIDFVYKNAHFIFMQDTKRITIEVPAPQYKAIRLAASVAGMSPEKMAAGMFRAAICQSVQAHTGLTTK